MVCVSVRERIRVCRRSVRHINWQTGTAVSEVDTSNLLLQKRMPPPECASLISNLVLISSCCPLRRIRWQVVFEESFLACPSLHLSPSIVYLTLWLSLIFCGTEKRPGGGGMCGGGDFSNLKTMSMRKKETKLLQQFMKGNKKKHSYAKLRISIMPS